MKVYAALDPRLPLSAVPGYAQRVELIGFDGLHVAETLHDSLAVALMALEHTTRLTVRTAVTLAFVRSPTLVAYTAWDLAALSGGRFELGLGTQIRQNIEGRYGMPWSEPRSRMRDYLGALEALFAAFRTGDRLDYRSPGYRLTRMQPYFNPGPVDVGDPPIWLGAVNAGMCELAGELTHGVVTHRPPDPAFLGGVVRPASIAGRRRPDAARRRRSSPRPRSPPAPTTTLSPPTGNVSAACWPSCTRHMRMRRPWKRRDWPSWPIGFAPWSRNSGGTICPPC